MADPLSVAASIAGLLSLADSAFRGVFRYSKAVSSAQDDIKALCAELRSVASVLHGLKLLAETMETGTQRFSQLRLEHVNSCRGILNEILRRIDRYESGTKSTSRVERAMQSLKWPFSKPRTSEMVTELSHQKATLQLALQASTMEDLMACLSNMKVIGDKVDQIHERVESLEVLTRIHIDRERTSILDFFMVDDPSPNLRTSWNLRQPLTGMWLTESPRFRQWLTEPRSKIWLSGIPGAGKTVLAGAVIREALDRLETEPNVGVGFFYCDYKKKTSWEISNILRALVAQLARQKDSAFEILREYHDKIQPRNGVRLTPDIEDLRDLLIRQTEEFDQVLIVVDGLDECGDKAGEVSRMLSEVVQYAATVSMSLSSRHEADIRDHLEDDFDHIPIAAHTEDVSLFVGAELEKRIAQKRLRLGDAKLKDEIMSRLIDGAKGMFRWVACQLDALCECLTDADRRAALHELPKDLPETYERILDRINQRHGRVQRLVQLSLKLIAVQESAYKLTIPQLCEAVSTPNKCGTTLHRQAIIKDEEIARACSSFIRRSTNGRFFEFSHFSVREYLQDSSLLERLDLAPYHVSDEEIYHTMTVQSLRFILLENFNQEMSLDLKQEPGRIEKMCDDFSFYKFAAMNWLLLAHRARRKSTRQSFEIHDLEKELLHPTKSNKYKNWLIVFCLHIGQPWTPAFEETAEIIERTVRVLLGREITTLHIAAGLNLVETGLWLIDQGALDHNKTVVPTVLDFAIAGVSVLLDIRFNLPYGHEYGKIYEEQSLRAALLTYGSSISDRAFWAPDATMFKVAWLTARECGSFAPLQYILESGWLLSPQDISTSKDCLQSFDGESALDFVDYLNKAMIYKTELGNQFCALIWNRAIQLGYKFTRDKSLFPSEITFSYDDLYHTAVKAIYQDDVEVLKECEPDPRFSYHGMTTEDENKSSLVHLAVQARAERILKHIISLTWCNIDVPDANGGTPLHYLVGVRVPVNSSPARKRILRLLIAAGASLLAADIDGWNAFHHAAYCNNAEDLITLLERVKDGDPILVNKEDPDGQIASKSSMSNDVGGFGNIPTLDRQSTQVGCCGGETCVWGLAASRTSPAVIQALVEADFPAHLDCASKGLLHSLGYDITFEAFEVLRSLHPTFLDSRKDGDLPVLAFFSACTSNGFDSPEKINNISVMVIRAFLDASPPLSSTLRQALDFCCGLVQGPATIERKMELIAPFLDYGFDMHPITASPSILRQSCHFLCERVDSSEMTDPRNLLPSTETRLPVDSPRALLTLILDHVDATKLNQLDSAGFSILHTLYGPLNADREWLIRELVKRGADINVREASPNQNTPLVTHLCASSFASATVLLNAGADPTLASPNSWNAAQAAIIRGNDMFLEKLLQFSAGTSFIFDWSRLASVTDNTNGEHFTGLNVLHLATLSGVPSCFDILVNKKLYTDIQSTCRQGYNCMHFAAWVGSVAMIEHLHKLGVRISQAGNDGRTPLHMAVRANKSSAVRKMLDFGSPVVEDIVGVTPSVLAERMNLKDIVEIFSNSNDSQMTSVKQHERRRRHSQ